MSRVTSRSRETTTRRRWADGGGGGVLPRELDEVECSRPVVDDDADQYLLFAVPSSRYCPSPAAAWADTGGKTRVWRRIDNGGDVLTAGGERDDGGRAALNGASTAGDRLRAYNDEDVSRTATTSDRVRVETRLTSTGQSPSSSLSPSSPHLLSPAPRPSAIPVRVTTSSTGASHVAPVARLALPM